jgi:hypothetical protein
LFLFGLLEIKSPPHPKVGHILTERYGVFLDLSLLRK